MNQKQYWKTTYYPYSDQKNMKVNTSDIRPLQQESGLSNKSASPPPSFVFVTRTRQRGSRFIARTCRSGPTSPAAAQWKFEKKKALKLSKDSVKSGWAWKESEDENYMSYNAKTRFTVLPCLRAVLEHSGKDAALFAHSSLNCRKASRWPSISSPLLSPQTPLLLQAREAPQLSKRKKVLQCSSLQRHFHLKIRDVLCWGLYPLAMEWLNDLIRLFHI